MADKRQVIRTSFFDHDVKGLLKKYPHVLDDLEIVTNQLKQGETPGDRLDDLKPYIVYKVRVPNRDAQRGKSGGYRLIYYVRTEDAVYLVTVYSKSQRSDVPSKFIRQLLDRVEAILSSDSE